MADATSFPQNLDLLHQREEALRGETKEAIAASDTLRRHFAVIEASMSLLGHFACNPHKDEDELTVQLLGIRLFNSAAGAVQCLTAGYYQNSVMLQRDILEVSFLLDYFHSNKASIAEWRGCTETERSKKFAAIKVRTELDTRDGFLEQKRAAAYKRLCTLGAHASYEGLQMLTPTSGGDAPCGPYFASRWLEETVAELAQLCAGTAANFVVFFGRRSLLDDEAELACMEAQATWIEHFVGPCDKRQQGHLDRLRAHVARRRQG